MAKKIDIQNQYFLLPPFSELETKTYGTKNRQIIVDKENGTIEFKVFEFGKKMSLTRDNYSLLVYFLNTMSFAVRKEFNAPFVINNTTEYFNIKSFCEAESNLKKNVEKDKENKDFKATSKILN